VITPPRAPGLDFRMHGHRCFPKAKGRSHSGTAGRPVRIVPKRAGGGGRGALAGKPHLVIWSDPRKGLTRLHLDEAPRWLLALPIYGRYQKLVTKDH
jgi:hypothetical protein